MNRCRWFWLACRSLVGTLALSLAIPIVAQAAPPTSPIQHAPTQIFQNTLFKEGVSGNRVEFTFNVPPGKVLVVENVSARVGVPAGQIVTAQLNCNGFSPVASIFLLFQRTTFDTQERFNAHQLTRCYAMGSLVAIVLRFPPREGEELSGDFLSVDVSIFGYLIDKP